MKRATMWFLVAVAALPMTVLAHEVGHLAAAAACGSAGLELHYSSMTYSLEPAFWSAYRQGGLEAAAAVVAPWKVAVSGVMAATRSPGPWGAAAAVAACSRAVPVALSAAATAGTNVVRGTDEAQLAAITGLPEAVLVLFGLACLIGSGWWVFKRVPERQRIVAVVATTCGVAAGVVAYVFAGPHLLP